MLVDMVAKRRDETHGNKLLALEYRKIIKDYVRKNGTVTAMQMYSELDLYDIPMYLALSLMVETMDLLGPDPYARSTPHIMSEMFYTIHPWS